MRICTQCKKEFEVKDRDQEFYVKIGVPEPKLCPPCRYQRRLAHRNERTLYRRKCDATGKDIVAIYPQESPYTVYEQTYWRSDAWDARQYGCDVDFSRPFFEQLQELRLAVPRLSLNSPESENSEYTNQSQRNKDCYMLVSCGNNEHVFYSMWSHYGKDLMDVYMAFESQRSYEAVGVNNSYNVRWSKMCDNCTDCSFCFDCRGCSDCFMSTNLRNKSYVWENEQLSKDEYARRLATLNLGYYVTIEELKARAYKKWEQAIHRFADQRKCERSTGDNLFSVENVFDSFHIGKSVDCSYCQDCIEMKDSYDCTEVAIDFELNYEVHGAAAIYRGTVLNLCSFLKFSSYCDSSFYADYLFGCVGVKRANHCILNKQYTAEEYDRLVPKIIAHMKEVGEWGEYFPVETSVFSYNETTAQEYFPLSKEEVIARGWKWQDAMPGTFGKETIAWGAVPDDIKDTQDTLCSETLACSETGKNFKIIKPELEFYKSMNIPIPRLHPDTRFVKRMALRNPRELYHRQCMCDRVGHDHVEHCMVEFETTYAPERPEMVYCEACYQKEII
ncbi:MAG: zinc-ribbon domain containing protein [Candidatus Uhrbacteria bacterium]|nr:zinc-ribbon domain containing protein [Candidatus Uhrbacteria bacterium]